MLKSGFVTPSMLPMPYSVLSYKKFEQLKTPIQQDGSLSLLVSKKLQCVWTYKLFHFISFILFHFISFIYASYSLLRAAQTIYLSIYLSAMSADIDDHGSPNISVLCTLYDFILCPRLFHSSFHASNITLSLPAPCSFPFKLPCADQIF